MNNENQVHSKKEILKFLGRIGVDTRFISLYESNVYINNLRFSKFSKKREEIFKNKYYNMNILRSTTFQKIAIKSSKSLSHSIDVKDKILIFNNNKRDVLSNIILESYLRKYGIKLIQSNFKSYEEFIKLKDSEETIEFLKNNSINGVVSSISMDEEVDHVLSAILSGKSLKSYSKYVSFNDENLKIKIVYPFINNVDDKSIETVCRNLEINGEDETYPRINELSNEFMNFLDDLVPYYKENILKSANFLNDLQ
ncbi:MAG: hypothetical protein LBC39_05390 [Methanobrevibacter sp.]|jgi:hypothetical protein|nr:hypothetical protein [Candidatus Methanovirga aequatorialis]